MTEEEKQAGLDSFAELLLMTKIHYEKAEAFISFYDEVQNSDNPFPISSKELDLTIVGLPVSGHNIKSALRLTEAIHDNIGPDNYAWINDILNGSV